MNHFQQYLVEEFAEDYQEGRLSRREAIKLIASVMGSVLLANSFLAACTSPAGNPAPGAQPPTTQLPPGSTDTPTSEPRASETPPPAGSTTPTSLSTDTVSPADPGVIAGSVEFPDSGSTLKGYLARPNASGKFPVILVCHENRGLTAHIQDVARRLAKAGYVALAVDLLSRQGGTEALGADQVPGALSQIAPEQFVSDFKSGYSYLQSQPFADAQRVGMVGFCFGGGVTWLVATQMPELKAAVPFYGPQPPVEDVPKINAAVLAIYAGRDQRINQGIPPIEEAMQQNNKIFEKVIYPDVDHAFHNDTGPRYNREAAQDAWKRTLAWFKSYV